MSLDRRAAAPLPESHALSPAAAETPAAERQQLLLPLAHEAGLERDDLLVTEANALAWARLETWRGWADPVLVLHGARGCGKTHMARLWLAESRGLALPWWRLLAADFEPPDAAGRPLLIDDAERLAGERAGEAALFHLINLQREAGAPLLLTARRPAPAWGVALPDLASRLRAAPAQGVAEPDDETLAMLLAKLFGDRQVLIGPGVVAFLVLRIERSFAEAARAVAAIDAAALETGRPITLAFVRRLFSQAAASNSAGVV